MTEENKLPKKNPAESILPIEDFEPEADLPPEDIEPVQEVSAVELQRQKHRLFEEWSQLSGVVMPRDIDIDKLNDQD